MAELGALIGAVLAGPARLGAVRLITIDGPSGSGKSTLAAELADRLQALGRAAAVVPTDHFATWDDPFQWWERVETGVLRPLEVGAAASYIGNDWSSGEPEPIVPTTFSPPEVLIIEGVSASRRAVASRTTVACWIEEPDRRRRLERAVDRDGERARAHLIRWQLAEDAWFAADGTKERADMKLIGPVKELDRTAGPGSSQ